MKDFYTYFSRVERLYYTVSVRLIQSLYKALIFLSYYFTLQWIHMDCTALSVIGLSGAPA